MGADRVLRAVAALLALAWRNTQRALEGVDASILSFAEEKLDGPVKRRLADGTILLLRVDWLADTAVSDPHLQPEPSLARFGGTEAVETLRAHGAEDALQRSAARGLADAASALRHFA